ncbi:MAG TPA: SH3 domain-containing protein [Chitinispirillaceae bacterium]|nr:SH3 domain-containing protein [Chitinispirillaceae bacterium]
MQQIKIWTAALWVMITTLLQMLFPSSVAASSVLSGLEIVSGDRGTILCIKSEKILDCTTSISSRMVVNVALLDCIYGLQNFSYTKFEKKSPVISLIASEKKNRAVVELQITLREPINEQPVQKRKNSDIYILLSKKPVDPFTWKAPTAFENERSRLALSEKIGKMEIQPHTIPSTAIVNKNEDGVLPVLTDITMVYREQICRINFQFNSAVNGTILRNRDLIVCSFNGVKNGLEKSVFEIHPRSVYKKIIISEKKGAANLLIAEIVVDTMEYMDKINVIFEDSLHFTVMAINKSSYNAFWSAHSGNTWEHELTYVKPYEIDLKKMGERAEKDVALNLSNSPIFRVGDFFSKSPIEETVRGGVSASTTESPVEAAPDTKPVASGNESKIYQKATSQMEPEKKDSVLIIADDVNVRQQPSVSAVAISRAMKGMYAQRLETSNGWTRITLNGSTGWINSKFIDEPLRLADSDQPEMNATSQVSKLPESQVRVEQMPLLQAIPNDSIAIQKVSQQIKSNEIFRDEQGDTEHVIRYHQKGRDPFKPLYRDSLLLKGNASIDQLQLVGVLIDGNEKVALLENKTSKNQAVTLRENDAVENGKVLKVFPDRIVFLLTEFGISRSFTLRLKGINTDEEARVR